MELISYLRSKARSTLGDRASRLEDCELVSVQRGLVNGGVVIFEPGDYALVKREGAAEWVAYSIRTGGLALVRPENCRMLGQDMPIPLNPYEVHYPGSTGWAPVFDYAEASELCIATASTVADASEWRAVVRRTVEHDAVAWIDASGTVAAHDGSVLHAPAAGRTP